MTDFTPELLEQAFAKIEADFGPPLVARYRELLDPGHADYEHGYLAIVLRMGGLPHVIVPPRPKVDRPPPPVPGPIPDRIDPTGPAPGLTTDAGSAVNETALMRGMFCEHQRIPSCGCQSYECGPNGERPGERVSVEQCRACRAAIDRERRAAKPRVPLGCGACHGKAGLT
jgi:hypothetical protein